jgi:hypothetical protein
MIQIVTAKYNPQTHESPAFWNCWLELTQGDESYSLPATAPGNMAEGDLLVHFEAGEARLWRIAQEKAHPGGLYQVRKDFEALADKAAAEVAWLEETIPQIETMTLEELRGVLKRLARENAETIRAWRYVIRRLK